jgi:hypothetical protein
MTLLLITVGGAVAGACILALLGRAWQREPGARHAGTGYPADPLALAEDREREATTDLLAGRINAERYRTVLASLAAEFEVVLNRPEG